MFLGKNSKIEIYFLWVCLIVALYFTYLIFKPFLGVLFFSIIIVTIFYPIYSWFLKKFREKRGITSIIMTLLIVIIVIAPVILFFVYTTQKSFEAYGVLQSWFSDGNAGQIVETRGFLSQQLSDVEALIGSSFDIKKALIDLGVKINSYLISGVSAVIKGTGSFVISILFTILTLYYLFKDGDKIAKYVMKLTPLKNKYDRIIFSKFRDVSYSALVSSFITALVQGATGAIGFLIAGVPGVFFAFVLMTILSFIPYVGSFLVWGPVGIYLLITGSIWQGIFLLIWGAIIVSLVDNLMRPYLMKGRTEIHPLLLFFSILGGIVVFGIIGIFLGPIIIAILITFLHIYELEYSKVLDKN